MTGCGLAPSAIEPERVDGFKPSTTHCAPTLARALTRCVQHACRVSECIELGEFVRQGILELSVVARHRLNFLEASNENTNLGTTATAGP